VFAVGTQAGYELSRRRPGLVRRAIRAGVRLQLPRDYEVDVHFNPRYDPWDERMCAVPSGDLFKAVSSGRASIVTDHIDTFTEHGLRLRSGAELESEIVVTATGLELLFLGGVELIVDGEPVELSSRLTYKGMMLEGVPNLAFAVGYTNASWTLKCDLTCAYVARLLNHMRRCGYQRAVPMNDDPSMDAAPLLDLSSGYVRRALDRMPKQGTRPPWRVYQSYLRDYRAMKLGGIEDGVLRLERAPVATPLEPAAGPA
jgi:monooxygenase